jgi:hypothetical protein
MYRGELQPVQPRAHIGCGPAIGHITRCPLTRGTIKKHIISELYRLTSMSLSMSGELSTTVTFSMPALPPASRSSTCIATVSMGTQQALLGTVPHALPCAFCHYNRQRPKVTKRLSVERPPPSRHCPVAYPSPASCRGSWLLANTIPSTLRAAATKRSKHLLH